MIYRRPADDARQHARENLTDEAPCLIDFFGLELVAKPARVGQPWRNPRVSLTLPGAPTGHGLLETGKGDGESSDGGGFGAEDGGAQGCGLPAGLGELLQFSWGPSAFGTDGEDHAALRSGQ